MIVCEYEFLFPNPENPHKSLMELDIYGHLPARFIHERDHRLSLRKDLISGKFELVKHYHRTKENSVIFIHSSLQIVLSKTNHLWNHYYGHLATEIREDKVCEHLFPDRAETCHVRFFICNHCKEKMPHWRDINYNKLVNAYTCVKCGFKAYFEKKISISKIIENK